MNDLHYMKLALTDLNRIIEMKEAGNEYISEAVYLAACSQADYLSNQIRLAEGGER